MRAAIALLFVTVTLCLAPAGESASFTTTLVSVNIAGSGSGNGESERPSISADGRFVAFDSDASNLTANDTNSRRDVFVRDMQTGTTRLVSVNSAGTGGGNCVSAKPSISADGRFVAFESYATNLATNDTDYMSDIFVRDMQTGTTRLVSVNSAGAGGVNGDSVNPSISDDGRYVVFLTRAGNLSPPSETPPDHFFFEVVVHDLQTKATTVFGSHAVGHPTISGDGRFVAYTADEQHTVSRTYEVFVHDLQTGLTTLVSTRSKKPSFSGDGRFLAFVSTSHTGARYTDIFVRDMQTNSVRLVSVNSAGTGGGDDNSDYPSISADGRFVSFRSGADNLVADDINGSDDIFVRDLETGTTKVVAHCGGVELYLFTFGSPSLSADGRFLVFGDAGTHTIKDNNGTLDVFVRDLGLAAPMFQFSAAEYSVDENGNGNAAVTVIRTGDTSTDASINYATQDGTATAGSDYTPTTGTLVFAPGETQQLFHIPITNDADVESFETINLTLSGPSVGVHVGTGNTATVTIADGTDTDADGISDIRDNCPAVANGNQTDADRNGVGDACEAGSLQLSSTTYSVFESEGSATITVTRTGGSSGNVFVYFDTGDGTANELDYTRTRQLIMFADGDTAAKTFTIPVATDTESETDETVHLRLHNPNGGASLGTLSTAVLTLMDGDAAVLPNELTLDPSVIYAGKYSTGRVKLNSPAPAGGALIMLNSWAPHVASVPSSLRVPEGAKEAVFAVTPGRAATTCSTTISATRGDVTKSATLTYVVP